MLGSVVAGYCNDEGGEPALGAGSPPHPRLMELINPHCERLELFLDQIAIGVI